jgi:tight adherence protein B
MSPLVVGIVLIVIAVILLVLGFLGTGESSVEERLSRYTESGPMETEAPKESKPKSNPLTDYLDKTVLFQSWVFVVVGGIIGLFIPGFYIRQKQKARLRQFENQIADMLNLTVNSLRAGYSILQALESVSKEMPVPTSAEIRRVVQEVQIGLTLDTALDNLLRRMNSADLKLVITAMNIQREVGGNLAEILDTISHTIRERVRIKGEISVMTAQQTYTGYLIALLPFILGGAIFVFNRSYVMRFVDEESRACGIPMLACGLIMIIAGFLAVRKIVQIDI